MYDCTSKDSFNNIHSWIKNIRSSKKPSCSMTIIGNKCDLSSDREVSYEEGFQLSNEYGLHFIEVSAKTGENISLVFSLLAEVYIESMQIKNGAVVDRLKHLHNIDKLNILLINKHCFAENCQNKATFHCYTKNCELSMCFDHIAEHLMFTTGDHQVKSQIKKLPEKEIQKIIELLYELEMKNNLLKNDLKQRFHILIESIELKLNVTLNEINEKNELIQLEISHLRNEKFISNKNIFKYYDINPIEFEKINHSIAKLSLENTIFLNVYIESEEEILDISKITIENMKSLDVYEHFCVGNYIGVDLKGNKY